MSVSVVESIVCLLSSNNIGSFDRIFCQIRLSILSQSLNMGISLLY